MSYDLFTEVGNKMSTIEQFRDKLPVLSALDLFCNKCCRSISITSKYEPPFFKLELSCHGLTKTISFAKLYATDLEVDKNIILATLDYIRQND